MRISFVVILSSLVVACGGAASSSPPRDTTPAARAGGGCNVAPVALRFAWPDGMRARVRGVDLTESAFADGSHPMRGESVSELRLEVSAEGDTRRMRFLVEGRNRLRSQGLAPDIAGARPTLVLDGGGAVVGVEGVDEMRRALGDAVARGELDPRSVAMIEPNLTAEAQLATAHAHWDWVVRAWSGQTLGCGQVVRGSATVPALSLGTTTPTEVDTELELIGEAPGEAAVSPEARCVALQVRQRARPGSLRSALAGFAAQQGAVLANATLERTIDLVVEVATLAPHRIVVEERTSLTWRAPGQPDLTRNIVDRQDYAFDYAVVPTPGAQRSTQIVVDPEGGGFAVFRDGQQVQLPPTPACRAFVACCGAIASAGPICGILVAQHEGGDCTEELATVRLVAAGGDGEVPTECR
ncbi:hypothetical protein [Sandaracinus amylolyticus]|uniref:Lipoprotein n=1 Tax=Sandaracinus amylolyticus TaxID=927083 RepID=A0A0F6W904_9BACT|nr:hypothetical protein [Sandaracinus amylolyticus]AKF10537.1 hypothetical protein DB32_007686 [Sandaracinus amylolyticus]